MSSPYYQFANTRMRFPGINWNAGSGGVVGARAPAQLGANEIPNLQEWTLGPDTQSDPRFRRTILHQRAYRAPRGLFAPTGVGDWPTIYPSGPEALDPNQDTRSNYFIPELSPIMSLDRTGNEDLGADTSIFYKFGMSPLLWGIGAAATLGVWWLWKRNKKRRNPGNPPRVRYRVYVGKSYAMSFSTKGAAETYASSLRRQGKAARVRHR